MRYVLDVTAEQAAMLEQAQAAVQEAHRTLGLMLSLLAAGRTPTGARFVMVAHDGLIPDGAIHGNGRPPQGPVALVHFDVDEAKAEG